MWYVESLRRERSGQRWAAVVAAWAVVECRLLGEYCSRAAGDRVSLQVGERW
jgi:hypothetical protein